MYIHLRLPLLYCDKYNLPQEALKIQQKRILAEEPKSA
jgi:hypothetical protein